MYKLISAKIVNLFIKNSIIKKDDKEAYEYGFELLISSAVSISAIMIISLFTKSFFASLLFMLGFVSARSFCGGYHADTHFSCFAVTMLNYFIFLLADKTAAHNHTLIFLLTVTVLSFFIIIFLSPVEHKNNPMTEDEFKRHRRKSRIFAAVCLIITVAFSVADFRISNTFSFMFGVFSVSISLVVSKLQDFCKSKRKEDVL